MLVVVEEVQKYDFFSSSPKFPQTEICWWWWLGVSGELVGLIGGDLAEGAVCFPSMRMT